VERLLKNADVRVTSPLPDVAFSKVTFYNTNRAILNPITEKNPITPSQKNELDALRKDSTFPIVPALKNPADKRKNIATSAINPVKNNFAIHIPFTVNFPYKLLYLLCPSRAVQNTSPKDTANNPYFSEHSSFLYLLTGYYKTRKNHVPPPPFPLKAEINLFSFNFSNSYGNLIYMLKLYKGYNGLYVYNNDGILDYYYKIYKINFFVTFWNVTFSNGEFAEIIRFFSRVAFLPFTNRGKFRPSYRGRDARTQPATYKQVGRRKKRGKKGENILLYKGEKRETGGEKKYREKERETDKFRSRHNPDREIFEGGQKFLTEDKNGYRKRQFPHMPISPDAYYISQDTTCFPTGCFPSFPYHKTHIFPYLHIFSPFSSEGFACLNEKENVRIPIGPFWLTGEKLTTCLMKVGLVNKIPIVCYNLLILGIISCSFLAFYFQIIDLSLKNILGSYMVTSIGIICNVWILYYLDNKEGSK